jgi:15-cis-phytoene synthase
MSVAVQQTPAFSPTPSQLAVAYSVCRSIARSSATNFYYAFLVLPKAKRQALCAVYAFMRRCDDIADNDSLPLGDRRQKLADWLGAVHRALRGHATDDPVLIALTNTQQRYKIAPELLDQLAYGTAMDIQETAEVYAPHVIYRTFEDLRVYCYRVASVVGLVCIRVFGYRDCKAEQLAENLGLAFQLTNIIRDVKEDATMGRIYLPAEELEKFDVSPSELHPATDSARLRLLLASLGDRAREYYRSGDGLVPLIDEDSQPALWVLLTIYRRLLERIADRHFGVFKQKIALPARVKLIILGKGLIKRLG